MIKNKMWTIGFISDIKRSIVNISINSRLGCQYEMSPIDTSYKINEIIGLELDDSFATSKDGKSFWGPSLYVKSDEIIVTNICHYSHLRFIIDNNLGRFEYIHSSISRYPDSGYDYSQDDLEKIAKILIHSKDSEISKMMISDGISRIIRKDLLYNVINNDPNLDYYLRKYIHSQEIGNYHKSKNVDRRNIEIETSSGIKAAYPVCYSSQSINIVNNTIFPDNYLNRLFRIRIILSDEDRINPSIYGDIDDYQCFSEQDYHDYFCATLKINKKQVFNDFNSFVRAVEELLKKTNEEAMKKYSYDEHLQFLMMQCRHARFLYKCRSQELFSKLVSKAESTYRTMDESGIFFDWFDDNARIPDINSYIVKEITKEEEPYFSPYYK